MLRIKGVPTGVINIFRMIQIGWLVELVFVIASASYSSPENKDLATGLFLAALIWSTVIVRMWSFWKIKEINEFIRPAAEHLSERFGLFTIIISGEAAVHVIEGAQYVDHQSGLNMRDAHHSAAQCTSQR
jgi:low temperature requirement protein LtrA